MILGHFIVRRRRSAHNLEVWVAKTTKAWFKDASNYRSKAAMLMRRFFL